MTTVQTISFHDFIYEPKSLNWNYLLCKYKIKLQRLQKVSYANTKSRCRDYKKYRIDKGSWPLILEDFFIGSHHKNISKILVDKYLLAYMMIIL